MKFLLLKWADMYCCEKTSFEWETSYNKTSPPEVTPKEHYHVSDMGKDCSKSICQEGAESLKIYSYRPLEQIEKQHLH